MLFTPTHDQLVFLLILFSKNNGLGPRLVAGHDHVVWPSGFVELPHSQFVGGARHAHATHGAAVKAGITLFVSFKLCQ
jgi:hypothetical protein